MLKFLNFQCWWFCNLHSQWPPLASRSGGAGVHHPNLDCFVLKLLLGSICYLASDSLVWSLKIRTRWKCESFIIFAHNNLDDDPHQVWGWWWSHIYWPWWRPGICRPYWSHVRGFIYSSIKENIRGIRCRQWRTFKLAAGVKGAQGCTLHIPTDFCCVRCPAARFSNLVCKRRVL